MKPAHDSIDDSIDDSIALSVSSYSGWQIMALYDSPRFSAGTLSVLVTLCYRDLISSFEVGAKKVWHQK